MDRFIKQEHADRALKVLLLIAEDNQMASDVDRISAASAILGQAMSEAVTAEQLKIQQ